MKNTKILKRNNFIGNQIEVINRLNDKVFRSKLV